MPPFRLCSLERALRPSPIVYQQHTPSFWKLSLLGPSLIHSACSPHLLCRVIITPHCGCEKAAFLSVPSKILLAYLAWGWEKTSGIKKKTTQKPMPCWLRSHHRFIYQPLPLVFFESFWPASSCWRLLLLPGSLHDSLLPIHGPVQGLPLPPTSYTDFLALGLWRSSLVPVGWRWLLFKILPISFWSRGRLPFAHLLVHSTNVYAPSRVGNSRGFRPCPPTLDRCLLQVPLLTHLYISASVLHSLVVFVFVFS